ncbi:protein EARLY RESPONSIVE TO DEHYDRATION 15 [Neltuma alba]|uniref:protein EARLY RESPONSIVE TO DEHYDRATION 15 n=1 Tax=Neltuma alba TaxID=207710 RepID=UPI0010A3201B|nr:protein EARLY RESPONSIVE TO DEHYDRATION 15-like [Prosopis alba]
MELLSGGRSTLNPNAPIYIPAAFRQVEDFSPEWWQLVTTLRWYHDYWLSQQQDGEGYYNNAEVEFDSSDVLDLLPDTFDLDADEDLSVMEAQLEEFILFSKAEAETGPNTLVKTERGAKPPTA